MVVGDTTERSFYLDTSRYMKAAGDFFPKNEKDTLYEMKLEVTSKTISGYLNGKQQFKPIKDDNLVDGRIGLGI